MSLTVSRGLLHRFREMMRRAALAEGADERRLDDATRDDRTRAETTQVERPGFSPQRRAFIQRAGAGLLTPTLLGAGLAGGAGAGCRAKANAPRLVPRDPQIAIIGGGMAGLACLHRLNQRGLDATVYEASSRVGGRMLSLRSGLAGLEDTPVELGGEFIDTGHATIRRLCSEFGLPLLDLTADPRQEPVAWLGGQGCADPAHEASGPETWKHGLRLAGRTLHPAISQ